jgi:hypothetical protein
MSQSQNLLFRRIIMAKAKALQAQPQASKTVGDRVNAGVTKVKDFGKNMGNRAKVAGTAAKAHVSRNRAAYIAGGAGLAAGAVGGAIAARRKKAANQD